MAASGELIRCSLLSSELCRDDKVEGKRSTHNLAIQGVHPKSFSPTSVQFKGEINDALPRKRHQKRHLEFCTAYLLSRGSGVRISPGAPLTPFLSFIYRRLFLLLFWRQADCHKNVIPRVCRRPSHSPSRYSAAPAPPSPVDSGAWFLDWNDASRAAQQR